MNSDYDQNQQDLLFFVISGPNKSSNFIKIYMDGFYTQRDFHIVQEHPKRSLDEELMTVRSWRLPMNSDYEQNQQGLLFFMIYGPNMSSNFIKLYMDGFYTQRDFHRV